MNDYMVGHSIAREPNYPGLHVMRVRANSHHEAAEIAATGVTVTRTVHWVARVFLGDGEAGWWGDCAMLRVTQNPGGRFTVGEQIMEVSP